MDILIKKDFTAAEIKLARLQQAQFSPSKHTSSASNVLNMADLGKTVVLCDAHAKKFAAKTKCYIKQTDYPYVMGNCDACKVFTRCQLYMREDLMKQAWLTKEQQRRQREYATIVG